MAPEDTCVELALYRKALVRTALGAPPLATHLAAMSALRHHGWYVGKRTTSGAIRCVVDAALRFHSS